MSSRTQRAVYGTLTSIVQYLLVILLQFLLIPLILDLAGDKTLGTYTYLLQIVGWAAVTDMGFGVATNRYLSQSHEIKDDRKRFINVFNNSRTFYLISNFLFAIIILIVCFNLKYLIKDINDELIYNSQVSLAILAIWIIVRTPILLFGEALIATQNMSINNIILAKSNLVRLALSLVMVYVGFGIIGLILAYITAEFLQFLLQRIEYKKIYFQDNFSWGIKDKKLFKEMFLFGLTYMLVSISSKISTNSDAIIVGSILGSSYVSILYVCTMPGALIYQFIWKIIDNSSPAMNDLFYKQKLQKIKINYIRIVRYSAILVFALGSGLILFNDTFIDLWVGAESYAGNLFNLLFSFFCISQVYIHINFVILVVIGKIKNISVLTFILNSLKILFCFLFLKDLGLYGIVVSNLFCDIPLLIYSQYQINKKLNINHFETFNIYIICSLKSLIPFIIYILLIQEIIYVKDIISFVVGILIFVLLFIINTFYISLNKNDRLIMRNFLNTVSFNK